MQSYATFQSTGFDQNNIRQATGRHTIQHYFQIESTENIVLKREKML
jgi:hypothetical protein